MTEDRTSPKTSCLAIADTLPIVVLAPVAAAQVSLQATQLLGIRFDHSAYLATAIFAACFVAAIFFCRHFCRAHTRSVREPWIPLVILGLIFAVLAFILVRFDADDTHYLPNAVYFLANPQTPMGFETYYIHVDGKPFQAFAWINAYANEFLLAAIAHTTGLDFLSMYWSGKTVVAAFLIPFAWYSLFRRFDVSHHASLGAIGLTLLTVFIMGDTFNAYGNWFLTRLFHAKIIVIALGLPLMWHHMMAFLDKPALWHWSALAIVATAMIGMSTMAGFILPASAFALMLAYGLANGTHVWFDRIRLAGLLSAFAYLLAVALFIRFTVDPLILENDGILNRHYPGSYLGQISFVTNPAIPLSAVILIGATVLAIRCLRGSGRRLLLWWCVIYAGLFLTPLSAKFLMENVTTTNTYWRLFHAYPVPLVLGIAWAGAVGYWLRASWRPRLGFALAAGLVLGAPHVLLVLQIVFGWERNAPTIVRAIHRISAGGPRISAERLTETREIIRLAPPGPMLAGQLASETVPILSAAHPQIYARWPETEYWFESRGDKARGLRRAAAHRFVSGKPGAVPDALFRVLGEEPGLKSIVIRREALNAVDIRRPLADAGFQEIGGAGRYAVFVSSK